MRPWLALVIGLGIFASNPTAFAQPAAQLGRAASLGLPQASASPAAELQPVAYRGISPDPLIGDYSPAARLGAISEVRLGPAVPADFADTPQERYNWGVPEPVAPPRAEAPSYHRSKFGEMFGEYFGKEGGHTWNHFESDHCFDDFISPMTNPFLAEDPRSLTELRPIFMYQTIPHNQNFNGGNLEFFGLRASVALTQRFSLTLNKLGGVVFNPGSDSPLAGGSGLAEVWLGGKYTFYRDDQCGTIAAAGVIFQIPAGPSKVFQDTGTLSIVPYGTVGQKFGKTSYGTFAVMDTLGYAISTDSQRSDYLYNSIHLDFDVANWQRFYPLIELNWFYYTTNGQARNLGIEGTDIANIGSAVSGRNYLTLAVGSRFKMSEAVQFGIAAEFPLINTHDLYSFRLGVDFIWRY